MARDISWRCAKAGADVSARLFLAIALLTMLGACNDAEEPKDKVVVAGDVSRLPDWLTPSDKMEPAVWLRSREVGHKVAASDPEVGRLRHALKQAAERFYEDQRMIANRTLQTGQMLAEARKPERYVDVMTGLVDIADASAVKKLYGEMCQHYLNIRKRGSDRRETIEQLTNAYKTAGSSSLRDKVP